MPKKRTQRVIRIKEQLIEKIRAEQDRPANHFYSNQELCSRYQISYLTAHRLISELCDENYLHRAHRSGTYIAADSHPPEHIVLVLHPNGKIPNTFGDQLLKQFQRLCQKDNIYLELCWTDTFDIYPKTGFPIVCGAHYDLREFYTSLHYGILINEEASAGINSTFTDSVLIDNRVGGMAAGRLLKLYPANSKVIVLAGPEYSNVVKARLGGIQECFPDVCVVHLEDWLMETAREAVATLELGDTEVVVCLHDAAADAFHERFDHSLPVIRFGDEMLAQAHKDTCLAIPWAEIVEECIRFFRLRSEGHSRVGRQHLFALKIILEEPWIEQAD